MSDEQTREPRLLDELQKGPWPSFVTEIDKARETSPACDDLLKQLELSYNRKRGTGSTAAWSACAGTAAA